MVGDRHVVVAELPRGARHLLDAGVAVGERRVHVQVAADVVQLDQLREPALARGLELAAVLAQLGRDVLHAEPLVDLLLGREGLGAAALVVGDPVLAHVQAAPHRLGAQRLVVLPGAREVLEQVAEGLLRHDPEVHRQPGVGDRLRAGLAGRRDRVDRVELRERLHERGRVARRHDDVEVLHGVRAAPGAARQLHAQGGRVVAQRGHHLLAHRERLREQHARLGAAVGARRQRGQDVLLGLRAEALHVLELAALGGAAQVVDRVHPDLVVEQLGALGAEPGDARDLHEARRDPLLQLVGGRDRAGLEQRVDLLGDRLPDARELGRAALLRQLGHGHAGLADRLRRVAVGDHAVHDRAVELVQARQLLECLRYLTVAHVLASLRAALPGPWLILPTYNEAENIEPLVRAVLPQLESTGLEHTVLVVDDNSPDGTGRDRRSPGGGDASASASSTDRSKQGLGRAYLAGFEVALAEGAELILEMDSDFSHDPADVPRLIAAAGAADLVLGSRYVPGGGVQDWGIVRRALSRGGSAYARAAARRAGARPDRRLQVLPPARARDDRPRGRARRRLRLPDRADLQGGAGGLHGHGGADHVPRAACRALEDDARGSLSRRSGRCPR